MDADDKDCSVSGRRDTTPTGEPRLHGRGENTGPGTSRASTEDTLPYLNVST